MGALWAVSASCEVCLLMKRQTQQGPSSPKQDCVLIYDGECRLCVSTKEWLERVGGGVAASEVRFLSYQSEEAMKTLGNAYRPGRPDMAFLIQPSGKVLRGLDAFQVVVSNLPGWKFWLCVLRFPPTKWLAEWGYRTIARHRYRWFGEVKATRSYR